MKATRALILVILLLTGCIQRHDRLLRQFEQDIGGIAWDDIGVQCLEEGIEQRIQTYNEHIVDAVARLLANPSARAMSAEAIEETIAAGGGSINILDQRDDLLLVEVSLRRCRVGSHDTRPDVPQLYVFDQNGAYWEVETPRVIDIWENTLGWSDGRWYFGAGFYTPVSGGSSECGLVHIVNQNGAWQVLGIQGDRFEWLHTPVCLSAMNLTYLDFYRSVLYEVTHLGTATSSLPLECELEDGAMITAYAAKETYVWDSATYQQTDTEVLRVHVRSADASYYELENWRDYCH